MKLKPHVLLDKICAEYGLRNDAELCSFLELNAPLVCRIRSGKRPVTADTKITIHHKTGMSISTIEKLAAKVEA